MDGRNVFVIVIILTTTVQLCSPRPLFVRRRRRNFLPLPVVEVLGLCRPFHYWQEEYLRFGRIHSLGRQLHHRYSYPHQQQQRKTEAFTTTVLRSTTTLP